MAHKHMLTTAILMVSLPLAACGGDTAPTPTTFSLPTADPAATVALTQSITSEDGALIVHYPEGWFSRIGISQVTLANDEAIFELESTPEADEAAISVLGISADLFPAEADGREMTVLTILSRFTGQASVREINFTEPEEFTTNGRPAASITGSGVASDQIVMVAKDGDNYIAAILASPKGMAEQYKPVVQAIVGAAIFNPEFMSLPTEEISPSTPES